MQRDGLEPRSGDELRGKRELRHKKIDANKPQMFKKAAKKFSEIGRLSMAAKHLKEVEGYAGKRIARGEFRSVCGSRGFIFRRKHESTANQCKLRVAAIAGQLERYDMAIETFEDCAKHAAENNLLKYSAKGYLLNADFVDCARRIQSGFERVSKI